MPNFFSKAYERIVEAFSGPRTKDTEYDNKIQELANLERSMQQIKSIFPNFGRNTQGIKYMCREISLTLPLIFTESNPYYPLIKDIVDTHQQIEKIYDNMVINVTGLQKHTMEWDKLFDEVRVNINQRETLRRVYDHYDEKFEKLVKVRNEKAMRNIQEVPKEIECFDRVFVYLISRMRESIQKQRRIL
jgi:hypothetical protein